MEHTRIKIHKKSWVNGEGVRCKIKTQMIVPLSRWKKGTDVDWEEAPLSKKMYTLRRSATKFTLLPAMLAEVTLQPKNASLSASARLESVIVVGKSSKLSEKSNYKFFHPLHRAYGITFDETDGGSTVILRKGNVYSHQKGKFPMFLPGEGCHFAHSKLVMYRFIYFHNLLCNEFRQPKPFHVTGEQSFSVESYELRIVVRDGNKTLIGRAEFVARSRK